MVIAKGQGFKKTCPLTLYELSIYCLKEKTNPNPSPIGTGFGFVVFGADNRS